MKKKIIEKSFVLFLVVFIILIISLVFNAIYLIKDPIIEYKNDENIIFFGDSITAQYDVKKAFPRHSVVNKGIGGNKTQDLIERIDKDIYDYNPSKVFILIGINDLFRNIDEEDILFNIETIIDDIKDNRSNAEIYVESLYPITDSLEKDKEEKEKRGNINSSINKINEQLKSLCKKKNIVYINVYDSLLNKEGKLKEAYTKDGLHLNSLGYLRVSSVLREYIEK